MSFSFSSILSWGRTALSTIAPVAQPIIQIGEEVAPIVEALVPGSVGAITAIEAGAAAITSVAPTAVADATAGFAAAQKIVTDIGPAITALETEWDNLFHVTPLPGGSVMLTPKTSTVSVPTTATLTPAVAAAATTVAPPGNAVS